MLYRTNAQSRALEEKFVELGVPYRIYGAVNFYSRKEIKDVLAYLKTIDNARDEIAVRRIINVPKRGIGATTIEKVAAFSDENGMSFYAAAANGRDIPSLSKATVGKARWLLYTYIRIQGEGRAAVDKGAYKRYRCEHKI